MSQEICLNERFDYCFRSIKMIIMLICYDIQDMETMAQLKDPLIRQRDLCNTSCIFPVE